MNKNSKHSKSSKNSSDLFRVGDTLTVSDVLCRLIADRLILPEIDASGGICDLQSFSDRVVAQMCLPDESDLVFAARVFDLALSGLVASGSVIVHDRDGELEVMA